MPAGRLARCPTAEPAGGAAAAPAQRPKYSYSNARRYSEHEALRHDASASTRTMKRLGRTLWRFGLSDMGYHAH